MVYNLDNIYYLHNIVLPTEADAGNAGEQPTRNRLGA
jgi:hypothetical protein